MLSVAIDEDEGIGTLLEALSLLPEHVTLKIVDGRMVVANAGSQQIRWYDANGRHVADGHSEIKKWIDPRTTPIRSDAGSWSKADAIRRAAC